MADPEVDSSTRARLEDAEEERWNAAGADLRGVIDTANWQEADLAGRMSMLGEAHDVLRPSFEMTEPTCLAFVTDIGGKKSGGGYDEETGKYILFPVAELEREDPRPILGGLAHELRHGYQHETIKGVIDDPRRDEWQRALARYDAAGVGSEWNPLELDAERAQIDVMVGYRPDQGSDAA